MADKGNGMENQHDELSVTQQPWTFSEILSFSFLGWLTYKFSL